MCSAESTAEPNAAAQGSTTNSAIKAQESATRNPNRRSNKPIMEKRRRARINNCLNELKSILLEAMRKDPARHSKLEKADILELTVSHLKALHRNQSQSAVSLTSPDSAARFRAGFANCTDEVGRFLSSSKGEGIDPQTSSRLLSHLTDCLNSPALLGGNDIRHSHSPLQPPASAISVPSNTHTHPHQPAYISLVPSRLSSGEIAFVVPGFNSSSVRAPVSSGHPSVTTPALTAAMQMHHQPMLSPEVPLELTVSSCSSSTSSSSLSPAYPIGGHSFHGAHQGISQYTYMTSGQGQPLALVTPKREDPDMSCWRPWCSSQEGWNK